MFKKLFLGLMLSVGMSAAMAGTINLGPIGCGNGRVCTNIPTDTGDVVTFSAPYGNWAYLYVNGKAYKSPSMEMLTSFDNYQMQAMDGSIALVTANYSTFRTCVRSGRGQTCTTHWNLLGGSVLTQ